MKFYFTISLCLTIANVQAQTQVQKHEEASSEWIEVVAELSPVSASPSKKANREKAIQVLTLGIPKANSKSEVAPKKQIVVQALPATSKPKPKVKLTNAVRDALKIGQ
jgi:hypothetical protein